MVSGLERSTGAKKGLRCLRLAILSGDMERSAATVVGSGYGSTGTKKRYDCLCVALASGVM